MLSEMVTENAHYFICLFHSEVLMKEVIHRFPQIEEAKIRNMVNGPESFTPDGKILLGEAPEVHMGDLG